MRIDGSWRLCEDGVVRPVVRALVRAQGGKLISADMLVDTGADRTVFCADLLGELGIPPAPLKDGLAGVGGAADSVAITTEVHLLRQSGSPAVFTGQFAAFTDPAALDMSVLGRDITNLFAVIVDRPQDVVCLLTAKHRYLVVEQ